MCVKSPANPNLNEQVMEKHLIQKFTLVKCFTVNNWGLMGFLHSVDFNMVKSVRAAFA